MSLQRIDLLLADSRIISLTEDYSDTNGIGDNFFLIAARHCLVKIQRYMVSQAIQPFAKYKTIAISAGHPVALPTDIFAYNLIYDIEYSSDGSANSYYPLTKMYRRELENSGAPEQYLVTPSGIYLDFVPTSGYLRLNYEGRLDRVDKRRGQIDSSSNILSGSTKTITLEADSQDDTALATAEYVCACDREGTVLIRNMPVEEYDSTSRIITIYDDFDAEDDETIPDGSYITIGKDTSTHINLPHMCEDLFIEFLAKKSHQLLSSSDESSSDEDFKAILSEIVEVYSMAPGGASPIPEHREEY